MKRPAIVLASASPVRASLLRAAGIAITVQPASIDERMVEAPLIARNATPMMIAAELAAAKALAVSRTLPEALVVGADQVLDFDGARWTKPASRAAARAQLVRLSGRSHRLESAVSVAEEG